MVKAKIRDVCFDEKSCRPVLVNFENGELVADKTKEFACSIFKNEAGSFIPTLTTEKMVYSNTITRDDDLYYNILAVRNKETNKVRLVALDTVSLKATSVNQKDFDLYSSVDKETTIMDLKKTFGSKRTQRQAEQSERLKVNVDAIRDELEKTVADIDIDSTFLEQSNSSKSEHYLPPKNESASCREDVYKIKDIVPKSVMKTLNDVAEKVFEDEENTLVSTEYVKNELERLRKSGDATINTVKLLLILDCLMSMSAATLKAISLKNYNPCPYSESMSRYLLDTFTTISERNTRLRSVSMKQKAISYILLFALICGNYQVNLDKVGRAMKLSVRKLRETCKVLLFVPNKKMANVFDLVLPLPKVNQRFVYNKSPRK